MRGLSLERFPFLTLGSHLDVGEGPQKVSVNSEGSLSISEKVASGLGQLPQLQPGGPAPSRKESSRKGSIMASLDPPPLQK